jgi:linoleate 10R-lipoxygenase
MALIAAQESIVAEMDVNPVKALALGLDTAYLSRRDPPSAPTGYYDWQITTDPADDVEGHSKVSNFISKVETLKARGGFQPEPKDLVRPYILKAH